MYRPVRVLSRSVTDSLILSSFTLVFAHGERDDSIRPQPRCRLGVDAKALGVGLGIADDDDAVVPRCSRDRDVAVAHVVADPLRVTREPLAPAAAAVREDAKDRPGGRLPDRPAPEPHVLALGRRR